MLTRKQVRMPRCACARLIGPQVPGGTYMCAYWQRAYEVLAIGTRTDDAWPWFTIRWEDGEVTTHMTPWDRRDQVLSQP